MPARTIAVIGGGISGIAAAHLLQRKYRVSLFEKDSELGGHAETVEVVEGQRRIPVDVGFIMFSPSTYPVFVKLLEQWGITSYQKTSLSFGFHDTATGFRYMVPEPWEFSVNLVKGQSRLPGSPAQLWARFREFLRFRRAMARSQSSGVQGTIGAFAREHGISDFFLSNFLLPAFSMIWSQSIREMLDHPMEHFVSFVQEHAFLKTIGRPQWCVIPGGSRNYVRGFRERFRGQMFTHTKVTHASRDSRGRLEIELDSGERQCFDKLVLAVHPHQAREILDSAFEEYSELLAAWSHNTHQVILHTDASCLPPDRALWGCWNFRHDSTRGWDSPYVSTYYLNKNQRLDVARDYFVTLNSADIPQSHILDRFVFTTPRFTLDSLRSGTKLLELNGEGGVYFCGAYLGHGFHEDGARSGVAVARELGVHF